jgi:hypothetical protein
VSGCERLRLDVVGRAALTARNLQKSHTKKPTKPTKWTVRRLSVGQKIGNNMPRARPKTRGSVGLEQVEHLLCEHAVISPKSLNRRLLTVQTPLLVGLLIGLYNINTSGTLFRVGMPRKN